MITALPPPQRACFAPRGCRTGRLAPDTGGRQAAARGFLSSSEASSFARLVRRPQLQWSGPCGRPSPPLPRSLQIAAATALTSHHSHNLDRGGPATTIAVAAQPLAAGRDPGRRRGGGHQKNHTIPTKKGAGNHFGSQKNSPVTWGNAAASLSGSQENLGCYPGNKIAAH